MTPLCMKFALYIVLSFQIRVDENGKIVDAKFKTFGCGSAIASSSLATEWVKGKSVSLFACWFFFSCGIQFLRLALEFKSTQWLLDFCQVPCVTCFTINPSDKEI